MKRTTTTKPTTKRATTTAGRALEHELGRAQRMLEAIEETLQVTKTESKRSALAAAHEAIGAATKDLAKRVDQEIAAEVPHAQIVKARMDAEKAIRAAEAEVSSGTYDREEALRRRDDLDFARQVFFLRVQEERESDSMRGSNANISAWTRLRDKITAAKDETDGIVRGVVRGQLHIHERYNDKAARREVKGSVEAGLRLALEPQAMRDFDAEIERASKTLKSGEKTVFAEFGGAKLEPELLTRFFDNRFAQIWSATVASDRATAEAAIARSVRNDVAEELRAAQ